VSEYIKREDVLKSRISVLEHIHGIAHTMFVVTVQDINDVPAADVEPVVRGESRINDQGFLECSACGKTLRMPLTSTYEMKRCYICGAHLERSGSGE